MILEAFIICHPSPCPSSSNTTTGVKGYIIGYLPKVTRKERLIRRLDVSHREIDQAKKFTWGKRPSEGINKGVMGKNIRYK